MMSSSSKRPSRAASARTVPDGQPGLPANRPESAPAVIDANLGFFSNIHSR